MLDMFNYTLASYPMHWQILFQKPATTMMEGIIDLHHDIMAFLVIVFIFVLFMLTTIVIQYTQRYVGAYMKFHRGHGITHNTKLETIWTIMPTIILLFIATPSFALVYALDEIVEPQLTVRVVGRQWYWTYEYPDTLVQNYTLPPMNQLDLLAEKKKLFLGYVIQKPVMESTYSFNLPQKTFQEWFLENYNEVLVKESFQAFYDDFVFYKQRFQWYKNLFDLVDEMTWPALRNFGGNSLVYQIYHEMFDKFWDNNLSGVERMFLDLFIFDKTLPLSLKIFFPGFSFDSYLIPTEDLFPGSFRLLEVDRRLVLPVNTNVRLLVTAYDVLHSWAVPAFGVKIDAVPGRLNEYFLNIKYTGVFYGQCSEICGVNHGFMPIKVEVVLPTQFFQWFALTSVLEAPLSKYLDFIQLDSRVALLLKSCSSFLHEENFVNFFWRTK